MIEESKLTYRQFVINRLRAKNPTMTITTANKEYAVVYEHAPKCVHFGMSMPITVQVVQHGMSVDVQIRIGAFQFYHGTGFTVRKAYNQALWRKRFMALPAKKRLAYHWDHLGERRPDYVEFTGNMIPLDG